MQPSKKNYRGHFGRCRRPKFLLRIRLQKASRNLEFARERKRSYVLSTSVVLTLKVTCGGKTVFVEGTSERRMGALQVPEFNIL
jgi:hypothetical protein